MGINTQRIRYLVLGIGSVMAVSSGLLKVFDTGIEPYSGMTLTLSAVIAVVLGGTRSLYGTIIASFILCLIQGLTEFYLSAQWKDAVTFTLLIGILLLKTEGILQFKIRVDER
jgi:branched-chain amino acid transport system permease protein